MASIDSSLHQYFPELIGPNEVRSRAELQRQCPCAELKPPCTCAQNCMHLSSEAGSWAWPVVTAAWLQAVGTLRSEIAEQLGLAPEVKVAAGSGDNQMSALGAGAVKVRPVTAGPSRSVKPEPSLEGHMHLHPTCMASLLQLLLCGQGSATCCQCNSGPGPGLWCLHACLAWPG